MSILAYIAILSLLVIATGHEWELFRPSRFGRAASVIMWTLLVTLVILEITVP